MADLPDLPVMTAAQYSDEVGQWLQQAYQWQLFAVGFPSYLAYQAQLQNNGGNNNNQNNNSSQQTNSQRPPVSQNAAGNDAAATPSATPAAAPYVYHEFRIPPIWKRFAAEIIDFFALFLVKLVVTFLAVDSLELFDIDNFFKKHDKSIYMLAAGREINADEAIELTSDIVLLELIHRFVVCVFEILCTFKGPTGIPGGATPGKIIMGIRILRCDNIAMLPDPSRVQIAPAADLGFGWASLRAIMKNLSVAFLFPVCMTFLFLPYNRTVYDVMSKSIVVEADYVQMREQYRRQQQQQRNNNNNRAR